MRCYFLFALLLVLGCKGEAGTDNAKTKDPNFSKTHVNPRQGYSEAVIVEAHRTKTIYISGQVGKGADFEAQFRDALSKLLQILKDTGATFDDVVKYRTFVVDYSPDYLPIFRAVRKELLGDTDMPASTLIGVEALGLPEWGIEIEAVAVVTGQ